MKIKQKLVSWTIITIVMVIAFIILAIKWDTGWVIFALMICLPDFPSKGKKKKEEPVIEIKTDKNKENEEVKKL